MPGVRELFEQEPAQIPKKSRGDLMREIDASYYGYLDDDDGILVPLEEKVSKDAMKQTIEEWKEKLKKGELNDVDDDLAFETEVNDELLAPRYVSHVEVPTQKDIEEALLRKKKRELMDKYGILE